MRKVKRDSKGRFLEQGTPEKYRFTSTNQPPNAGRKPSRFKSILSEIEEQTGEPLTNEDYRKIITQMLTLNPEELMKIAKNPQTPVAIIVVASAIAGDIETQNIGNVEKLLERVFDKTPIKHEITSNAPLTVNINVQRRKKDD